MIDTEVFELIGATARARLTDTYAKMTAAGAPDGLIRRVLTDQLTAATAAARIDGEALAIRQLTELGIDVAPDYGTTTSTRAARRAATAAAAEAAAEDRSRFGKALDTILRRGATEAAAMKVGRLALAEAIEAARDRSVEMMRGRREVDGWIRQLDSDPCELCTWWARDGRVWPATHTMPTHKGCACAQRWTVVASAAIRLVSKEAQQASAARAAAMTGGSDGTAAIT